MNVRLTPCQADPVSFDLDPDHGAPHLPVAQLQALCMSCPMLRLCRELDHTDVYGVVAGRYRPHPVDLDSPVAGSPKYRQAMEYLLQLVDVARPGDKLPTVREISDHTNVYRHAVIAALNQLASQGLITAGVRGHARYVLPTSQTGERQLAAVS